MDNNDYKTLAETVRENTAPEIKDIARGSTSEAEILLVPEGMRAESLKKYLDEYKEKPDRREGTISTTRVESFNEVVNRFKNKETVLFASAKVEDRSIAADITAIFDYHPAGDDVTKAENLKHRAVYNFPISKAFKNWLEMNTKAMTQLDFAYFLEKRLADLSSPTDADKALIEGLKPKWADPINMLELARDLEIYSSESFVSKQKTSSGEYELKFTNNHADANGKPLSIPDFFVVNIPVFEGGPRQRILSHLRYRKDGTTLVWFYELYNIDEMLAEAFEKACAEVKEAVKLPLIYGKAEK